ncbi:hypothetical protein Tco_0826889 [Tanacetum coccineum]
MAFLIVCYDDVRRNESRSLYDRICASVELNLKDRPWNLVANHWDPDIYDRWIAYLYTELDQAKRKLMRARYKLLKWMCLGDEMGAGLGAEKRAETSGFGCWCGGENRCAWTLKRGLKRVHLVAERVGLGADVGAEIDAEMGALGAEMGALGAEVGAEMARCQGDLSCWIMGERSDNSIGSLNLQQYKRQLYRFITRVMQMANEKWEAKIHSDIRRLEQQLENLLSLTLMRSDVEGARIVLVSSRLGRLNGRINVKRIENNAKTGIYRIDSIMSA